MSEKDGGPAFPAFWPADKTGSFNHGMTLRDYFATAALIGLLGGPHEQAIVERMERNDERRSKVVSELAFMHADAMLAAREKADG